MIKVFKNKIISLGLNLRKESLFLIISNGVLLIASVILPLLLKNLFFLIPCLMGFILLNLGYYWRITNLELRNNRGNLEDFVTIFTFIRIYIQNGMNVYNAIQEASQFADNSLRQQLDELIQRMDEDKSVQPFMDFASNYKDLFVEQIMVALYQIIDNGNNADSLYNFESIFDKFSEIVHKNELDNKEKQLSSMSITPLIGSAILILMITFGIIQVIGEMTNGL